MIFRDLSCGQLRVALSGSSAICWRLFSVRKALSVPSGQRWAIGRILRPALPRLNPRARDHATFNLWKCDLTQVAARLSFIHGVTPLPGTYLFLAELDSARSDRRRRGLPTSRCEHERSDLRRGGWRFRLPYQTAGNAGCSQSSRQCRSVKVRRSCQSGLYRPGTAFCRRSGNRFTSRTVSATTIREYWYWNGFIERQFFFFATVVHASDRSCAQRP